MKENSINYVVVVVVVNPNEPENSVHKVWDRVSAQPRRIDSSYSIHKLHNSIGINQFWKLAWILRCIGMCRECFGSASATDSCTIKQITSPAVCIMNSFNLLSFFLFTVSFTIISSDRPSAMQKVWLIGLCRLVTLFMNSLELKLFSPQFMNFHSKHFWLKIGFFNFN